MEIAGCASSLLMMPVAWLSLIVALVGLVRLTRKNSFRFKRGIAVDGYVDGRRKLARRDSCRAAGRDEVRT